MEIVRLYGKNDMVKAGCHDCRNCSECCRGMADTVVLDPYDIYRLTGGLQKGFEELMAGKIALHVEDGIILPHMQMTEGNGHCVFLNAEGRCSIHAHRPGLCRLFPLGRSYEDGKLRYFMLEACPAREKTKVKVEKWIATPDFERYERFLVTWHYFLKALRSLPDKARQINMLLLQTFFVMPYAAEIDFFSQFEVRLQAIKEKLADEGVNFHEGNM